jgi:hypothetical protein
VTLKRCKLNILKSAKWAACGGCDDQFTRISMRTLGGNVAVITGGTFGGSQCLETSFHWAGPGQDPVVAALAIEVVASTV